MKLQYKPVNNVWSAVRDSVSNSVNRSIFDDVWLFVMNSVLFPVVNSAYDPVRFPVKQAISEELNETTL